jgi:hypothetical protein
MMTFKNLVEAFKNDFGEQLRVKDYLLADTRIAWVSLYDHLALTGGLALLPRGSSGTGGRWWMCAGWHVQEVIHARNGVEP